jgi:antitoxin component YwqK of YwqJK toxin-antitoxin module
MKSICTILILASFKGLFFAQQTRIEDIKLETGCPYFSTTATSSLPLLAQEPVGNVRIYCAAALKDTLLTMAYKNGLPFTGVASYSDTNGIGLGFYTFKNGLIEKIEEFNENGTTLISLNFIQGLANGENKVYYKDGSLHFLYSYCQGIKDGPFYMCSYTDNPNCQISIAEGYYKMDEQIEVNYQCKE